MHILRKEGSESGLLLNALQRRSYWQQTWQGFWKCSCQDRKKRIL